jgi:malonyl CoA-acyl carrier protein transacylase
MSAGRDAAQNPQPTGYQLKDVERLLAEDDRTSELQIRLTMTAGQLVVRGRVASLERIERVLQIIREQCPDVPLVDELEADEETLAKVPGPSEEIS